MTPAVLLLMLAICAVWLPAPVSVRAVRVPAWLVLLLLSLAMALASGELTLPGVAGLLLLGVSAAVARHAPAAWQRALLLMLAIVMALLLALHRWPGFHNTLVVPAQAITPAALPFALYANLDKGAAGLLLLALLVPRSPSLQEGLRALRLALLPGLITIAVVMALACAVGMVKPEWKWPAFAPAFFAINLLLTVVAEEAFFRGVLQYRLHGLLREHGGSTGRAIAAGLAVGCSALLFGAAHLGGGLRYAALATLAGLGYALVFQRSGRIESAIALHFALNAVHLLYFTYPALA